MTVANGQTFGSLYQRLIFSVFRKFFWSLIRYLLFSCMHNLMISFFHLVQVTLLVFALVLSKVWVLYPTKLVKFQVTWSFWILMAWELWIYMHLMTPKECLEFFTAIEVYISERLSLLGDFNSVTDPLDRLSGNLDRTSTQLFDLLLRHNLEEIEGPHHLMFSYHHPSVRSRKSHMDRIYVNFLHLCLWGYSTFSPYSDHYLVEV